MKDEAEAFGFFSKEFWIVVKYALPFLIFFLIKNYFLNFVAYLIIKFNTSYQYQNKFSILEDGVKRKCQVMAIKTQYVLIVDVVTEEYTQIETREFRNLRVWHKSPRIVWTKEQREEHRQKEKEKENIN